MIVVVTSIKGSPGATSTALVLSACWPRPVVLIEADSAGGDLAYRCAGPDRRPVPGGRGLVSLAAEVRTQRRPDSLTRHTTALGNGVELVQGVASARQAMAMTTLWPALVDCVRGSGPDVVVDLGRLRADDPLVSSTKLLSQADHLLVVATAALESVMHLAHGLPDLLRVAGPATERIRPLLVGETTDGRRDCSDLDRMLGDRGLRVSPSLHVPFDPRALVRLELGESAAGRLARTPLVRSARSVAEGCLAGSAHQPDAATLVGEDAAPSLSRWSVPRAQEAR